MAIFGLFKKGRIQGLGVPDAAIKVPKLLPCGHSKPDYIRAFPDGDIVEHHMLPCASVDWSTKKYPNRVRVFLVAKLSKVGQLAAVKLGKHGHAIQMFEFDMASSDPDLDMFSVDHNGYVLGATYENAVIRFRRNVPRFSCLDSNIELDFLPECGYDVLEAIKEYLSKPKELVLARQITTLEEVNL